jgi:hypothetical protein
VDTFVQAVIEIKENSLFGLCFIDILQVGLVAA